MIQAIGETLAAGTAIAISILPIVGLIVFVTSKGGRIKGTAYALGWFLSLWVATFLLAWIGNATTSGSNGGDPSAWAVLLQAGLGVVFLLMGVLTFIKRPKDPSHVKEPKWMAAVDSTSAIVAFGFGALLVVANGKNLPLIVLAAVDFTQANLSTLQLGGAVTVFALIGSSLMFVPTVLALVAPKSSAKFLDEMRTWLMVHDAPILAVIFLMMGVSFLGKAISALG